MSHLNPSTVISKKREDVGKEDLVEVATEAEMVMDERENVIAMLWPITAKVERGSVTEMLSQKSTTTSPIRTELLLPLALALPKSWNEATMTMK